MTSVSEAKEQYVSVSTTTFIIEIRETTEEPMIAGSYFNFRFIYLLRK